MKPLIVSFALLLFSVAGLAQGNFWHPTDFPAQYGGEFITLHIAQNGTIFAGTWMDGLMRSTDNGESWERVREGDMCNLIASTSTGLIFASFNGNLVRSSDNGTTWFSDVPTEWEYEVQGLAVNSSNQVFVSLMIYGAYRSDDNGNSWVAVNAGLPTQPNFSRLAISPIGPTQTVFLSHQDTSPFPVATVYRSTNSGNSWAACPLTQSYLDNLFVHSNGYIFAKSDSGLLRSTDNGDSWRTVWLDFNTQQMVSMPNGDIWSGYNYTIPYWGTPLIRSTDNGSTWGGFDTVSTAAIYALARSQDGSILIGTGGTGLLKTTDSGLTWNPKNKGLPNPVSQVTTIVEKPGGIVVAGTSKFGTYVSTDRGGSWTRNNPGNLNNNRIVAHPDGSLLAASLGLGISSDNGNHWEKVPIYASDVAIDTVGNIYICGLYDIQRSTDLGATWTILPAPNGQLTRMHITRHGTIVVDASWYIPRPSMMLHNAKTTTNGGATWMASTLGSDRVSANEFASCGNGYLFAATQFGVYRSTNSGQSWTATNNGLLSTDVRSLAVNSLDVVFAGTATRGVFLSRDFGESWEPFNTGLTDTTITSLYCNSEGYLYAGGWNKGILKTSMTTASVGEDNGVPLSFSLEQNYPNPFNPSTTIEYQLSKASHVTLKVFNMLGQEVATLMDESKPAGPHAVQFDAGRLATGVYFCRLQAEEFIQTRRLMILK